MFRPDCSHFASRDAQDAAGLLVARFQLQGHGQVVGQPQRQRRQRLTDGEGVSPRPEVPGIPLGAQRQAAAYTTGGSALEGSDWPISSNRSTYRLNCAS